MDKGGTETERERNYAAKAALKSSAQQKEYRTALGRIASMMHGDSVSKDSSLDPDPLFTACAMVGKAGGITFVKPYGDSGGSHEDPIQFICRFSAVRARSVMLRNLERWWTLESGPMLCFSREGKKPLALIPGGTTGYQLVDPSTSEIEVLTPAVAEKIAEQAWMGGSF